MQAVNAYLEFEFRSLSAKAARRGCAGSSVVEAPTSNRPLWKDEGGAGFSDISEDEMARKVLALLRDEWPREKNSSLLDTWRGRDALMRQAGPPFVVLHWRTIADLGRIPHSNEGHTMSVSQAAAIASKAGKRFFLEMFSHRWFAKDRPDDFILYTLYFILYAL